MVGVFFFQGMAGLEIGGVNLAEDLSGQFITTFPAGWSPQMVVIVRESPPNWP